MHLIQGYHDNHVIVKINRNRVKLTNASAIKLKKDIHYPFYVKSVNFVNLDHLTMCQLR